MATVPPLVRQVSDSEAKGQARALFEQMKQRTGKVPKWMRVMANCEDVLVGFFAMFKATMDDTPISDIRRGGNLFQRRRTKPLLLEAIKNN